eukprot:3939644-Rhodomonas_salina.2
MPYRDVRTGGVFVLAYRMLLHIFSQYGGSENWHGYGTTHSQTVPQFSVLAPAWPRSALVAYATSVPDIA